MTISKIKLKFGNIEIEYEGEQQYLISDLDALLSKIDGFSQHFFDQEVTIPSNEPQRSVEKAISNQSQNRLEFTIGPLAAKLNVKTGPELVICAIGHLHFVGHKETSTRKEIISSIKQAANYYKKTYLSNLSSSLENLVKQGTLLEKSKDTYSLSAEELQRLETIIAQLN